MFLFLFSSAKPQEYKARLEKRHDGKKEVLGHSKQAEFIRLMEQEVEIPNIYIYTHIICHPGFI